MKKFITFFPLLFIGHILPATAITINLDYSYDNNGFFADNTRRNILETAVKFFETRLTDNLAAITSDDVNYFNVVFNRPDTGQAITLENYDIAEDTLTIFAGGRDLGGSLGIGGPGSSSFGGYSSYVNTILARGQGDGNNTSVDGNSATDFAPWGGTISFNSAFDRWYFDTDLSTDDDLPFSDYDFYSVALHELAHVLGFGTSDSWANWIVEGKFTGLNAIAANGGSSVALTNYQGHWARGTQSDGQETAMDPNITNGSRKEMTSLDMAALADIGWDIAQEPPTPEAVMIPIPVEMLGAALGIFTLIGTLQARHREA